MRTIDYTIPSSNEYTLDGYLSHYHDIGKLLFFDIETTGFIAKNTTLYLIGVLWYADDHLHLRQWFNEDGYSEKEIILSFIEFCNSFTHLVHFNGLGFDLPYLKQKSDLLSISFDIDHSMSHIDIYKEIRSYKKVFALDNMKQVSIEKYLNIQRKDTYSGKELINIYQRYVACPNVDMETLLLLHNHDDVLGMTRVCSILHYKHFFHSLSIHSVDMNVNKELLTIHFEFDDTIPLPKRLIATSNGIYLNAIDCKGTLQIPIYYGELKYYYADYKNYYYLPMEDMAIHKSIATYVEAGNKVKATKDTCYIKKKDMYILCNDKNQPEHFRKDLQDSSSFIPLSTITEGDMTTQIQYIKNTLLTFL